jgi:hypothetical protein
MEISPELRRWLPDGTDPSVRYRVLREVMDRPESDPEVTAAHQQIGKTGWAAEILQLQHPTGQWTTVGSSVPELYRPKYISTN